MDSIGNVTACPGASSGGGPSSNKLDFVLQPVVAPIQVRLSTGGGVAALPEVADVLVPPGAQTRVHGPVINGEDLPVSVTLFLCNVPSRCEDALIESGWTAAPRQLNKGSDGDASNPDRKHSSMLEAGEITRITVSVTAGEMQNGRCVKR
ncbi:MAG: hypothetical protein H6739_11935 [Alphaproteobacteria bacterium]|nr:hypothetical protein [Alphaproteobacteria bacterium]